MENITGVEDLQVISFMLTFIGHSARKYFVRLIRVFSTYVARCLQSQWSSRRSQRVNQTRVGNHVDPHSRCGVSLHYSDGQGIGKLSQELEFDFVERVLTTR